jgi:Chaperone of endosialidase
MANTYTPTYNLIQPEVGADTNAWGTHLNTDLTTIDTHMLSRALTTSQTAAGPLVFGQTLRVNGDVTFDSTALVTGNTTLSGTLTTSGAASFSSTLAVTGAVTLSSTLAVTGAATLSSTLAVSGATTLASNGLNVGSGQLAVSGGNVSMSGNLAVTGNAGLTTLSTSGAATLSSTLAVTGATTLNAATTINLASAGALNINTSGTLNGLCFYSGSTITGQLGASSTYPFYVSNASGTGMIYSDTSGNFTATANISAYSDAKLKTNVRTIDDALALIEQLRGVYYERIDSGEEGIGVIAQEVKNVFPQAVHENDGTLAVSYGNLVGPLIEAVKILSARVKKLEVR